MSPQEYPVNTRVPKVSVLSPKVFLLCINHLSDVVCNTVIYADDTTLCSNFDKASYFWQQLELASEVESERQDTVDWDKKWLIYFNARKTQLVLFDPLNSSGAIDVKMNKSFIPNYF